METLRDHGMNPERRYWHEQVGFNFRMTNLQASIGCAQLERMDHFLRARHLINDMYVQAMSDIPGVTFPSALSKRCSPVTWFACVLVPPDKRLALIQGCREANIDLRPFFHSLSAMPAYQRFARFCPESRKLSISGINLPTSQKVDERISRKIAEIFRKVLS
jgi:perosamine synthetase